MTLRLMRKRQAPETGIVHLGLGAFFRSFGALMIEEAMDMAGGDWGIVGVSLKSPGIRDRLKPQGNAYTAVEVGPKGQKIRAVEVLSDVYFAPEDPGALLAQLADSDVKIVSLTVTEKGYCHIPGTGTLNLDHPDVRHDIENPHPQGAIGYLVRALEMRRAAGLRPFTVLSCDNLPDNGRIAHNVVVGLAEAIDPGLANWIAAEARFPTTMIDRIVPATTPQDIDNLTAQTGYMDLAPVFHEPFRQWVIEDDFVDGIRPAVNLVSGVQLVADVAPFELMKVRMLNGTHSALAYLGYLAGYETIAETVNDPVFRDFARKLWSREIIPTLTAPKGVNLHDYADQLLDRYSNPAIRHRTWQIAMDGSQKLPQRILGTISYNLAVGRSCPGLILAVAAWMRYVGGVDENGALIEVKDPLANRLRHLSDSAKDAHGKVEKILSVEEVFGSNLGNLVQSDVSKAFDKLRRHGARTSCQNMKW